MVLLTPTMALITRLQSECLEVATVGSQKADIKIGILNLMPLKQETEYHFASLFAKHRAVIELHFLKLQTHISKNTPQAYLDQYYSYFSDKIDELDIVIFTGAPIEELPFESVTYWKELQQYFDIIQEKKIPLIGVCWSAQAALYHYRGIQKRNRAEKAFGVFRNTVVHDDVVLKNLTQEICLPVSRHSELIEGELQQQGIKIILNSDQVGVFLLKDEWRKHYYITGHPEYSANILKNEYERDLSKHRKNVAEPIGYSLQHPTCFWQANATRLYHNIIDEMLHVPKN